MPSKHDFVYKHQLSSDSSNIYWIKKISCLSPSTQLWITSKLKQQTYNLTLNITSKKFKRPLKFEPAQHGCDKCTIAITHGFRSVS